MNHIKIGACDWGLPGAGLNAVRIASEFGLDAISLKIGFFENNYPIAEKTMQKYYLEDQQKYGIEYCAIALNDFDHIPMHARKDSPVAYEKAWTILNKGLKTAIELKIPVIQVAGFAASEVKTEEDLEYSAKALQYLCDEAGQYGIRVAYENLMTPEEFKIVFEMVGRKSFGAYYDSQNYHLYRGYDQLEVLEGLFPYMLSQVHVKDGNGALSGALLGKGDSNFFGSMKRLSEKGFRGHILLENYYDQLPLRLEQEDPYRLLETDIKTLRETIAKY
ncbi:MAG TPA: sugar phosphate isomerase/epimerase family protein [Anaerovoracaceae bacterium]|nr:sugar phosphate isomerase/epimerase family protein [Anaerovoracaceae bacterium]